MTDGTVGILIALVLSALGGAVSYGITKAKLEGVEKTADKADETARDTLRSLGDIREAVGRIEGHLGTAKKP